MTMAAALRPRPPTPTSLPPRRTHLREGVSLGDLGVGHRSGGCFERARVNIDLAGCARREELSKPNCFIHFSSRINIITYSKIRSTFSATCDVGLYFKSWIANQKRMFSLENSDSRNVSSTWRPIGSRTNSCTLKPHLLTRRSVGTSTLQRQPYPCVRPTVPPSSSSTNLRVSIQHP